MKGKIKNVLKAAPLAIVAIMLLTPSALATSGEMTPEEGTIIAAATFVFLAGVALIFWVMPQKKEKKIVPTVIGLGIAIAIMALIFYFIQFATGYNITIWTEWITYTGHETAVLTAVAGSFLILLVTAYAAYQEKNDKKERDIVALGFLAMIIYAVIVLFPALTFV